jgi:hypothetical protein
MTDYLNELSDSAKSVGENDSADDTQVETPPESGSSQDYLADATLALLNELWTSVAALKPGRAAICRNAIGSYAAIPSQPAQPGRTSNLDGCRLIDKPLSDHLLGKPSGARLTAIEQTRLLPSDDPWLTLPPLDHIVNGVESQALSASAQKHLVADDAIAQVIARHEGSPTSVNWNDNGAGISVGMFQANQRFGELPTLLRRMADADPERFSTIFGGDFQVIVKSNPEKIRSMCFTNWQKTGPNALGAKLKQALSQPAFQKVQAQMLAGKIGHAAHVARQYGIESEAGVALVADMINQLGEGSAISSTGARKYLQFAVGKQSESEKLAAVVDHDYKGHGRFRRDRDILANLSLKGIYQPFKTKQIAIESEANHRTDGYISDI